MCNFNTVLTCDDVGLFIEEDEGLMKTKKEEC
jgi:hypothetical protein